MIRVIPPAISLSDSCPDVCIELLTLPLRFAATVSRAGLRLDSSKNTLTIGKVCRNVADDLGNYCLSSAVLGGARIRAAHAAVRSESG